jgi:hypothetical protein
VGSRRRIGWRISAGGIEVRVRSLGDSSPVVVEEVGGGGSAVAPPQAWVTCWQWVGPEGAELAGMKEAEEERRGCTWRAMGLCVEKDQRRRGEEEDQGERRGCTVPLT